MKTILIGMTVMMAAVTARANFHVVGNGYAQGPAGTCELSDREALVARLQIEAARDAAVKCETTATPEGDFDVYVSCMKPAYDDAQKGVQEYYQVIVTAPFVCARK